MKTISVKVDAKNASTFVGNACKVMTSVSRNESGEFVKNYSDGRIEAVVESKNGNFVFAIVCNDGKKIAKSIEASQDVLTIYDAKSEAAEKKPKAKASAKEAMDDDARNALTLEKGAMYIGQTYTWFDENTGEQVTKVCNRINVDRRSGICTLYFIEKDKEEVRHSENKIGESVFLEENIDRDDDIYNDWYVRNNKPAKPIDEQIADVEAEIERLQKKLSELKAKLAEKEEAQAEESEADGTEEA